MRIQRMNSAREQEQNELLHEAVRFYAKEEYSQALRIYRQLADSGHSESQVFLGWMLAEGMGVEASHEDAAKWFRRAALLGSAKGAFYMGRLLAREAKYADAVLWYQRSAADGYPPSQFRLGVSYLMGEGVQKDFSLACRHLEAAKANGHLFARRELAILDIRGERGVARRFLGIIEFLLVLLYGIGVAFSNSYSDDLKG
ncbi:hypothetical protein AWV79_24335 [Cupriavidus sp. UYMMa02A]|nr:hypothetical protein AWV79_24335 [Cupriavidus sp. UYMMa02A]